LARYPPAGNRAGGVIEPSGNTIWIAAHVEERPVSRIAASCERCTGLICRQSPIVPTTRDLY
jgi:hypothetical protein